MICPDHFYHDEDCDVRVNDMIEPSRKESVHAFWQNKLTIDCIQEPKHSKDIDRQWKSKSCKDVISHSTHYRSFLWDHFVRADKIIQQCDDEVERLEEL